MTIGYRGRSWLAFPLWAALVLLPVAALTAQNRPADLFTDIYNRGTVKQRTMKSLRARFTETTTSSLLLKPIVAHGTVIAAGPTRVLMTYTDPEPKTIAMDAKTLTIAWTNRQERQQINISDIQKRIDHYFTNASVNELRSMFDIVARPDTASPRRDYIDMKPKRKQIKEGLERLELWIDRDSDLLSQMRLSFPGGDEKTIVLEDFTVNLPLTDDMFRPPSVPSK